jgi:hypothetical protein
VQIPFAFQTDLAGLWPEWGLFREALKRRDWPACRVVLDSVGLAQRTRLLQHGAEEKNLEDWLRGLIRSDTGDGALFALLGHHLTNVGWAIRTASQASRVSRRQWRGFYDWVEKAEQVLIEGVARHPSDPAVWAMRLTSGRGISLGQDEAARRYDRLCAIDEHHLPAQTDHLQQLLPKWGGDWERAHAFARDRTFAAPPGSPQAMMVPIVYLEHMYDTDGGFAGPARVDGALPALHEAANHSIWHPDFVAGHIESDLVLGQFAVGFRYFGDRAATARVFQQMDRRAVLEPWSYLDESVTAVAAARLWAGGGTK